MMKETMSCGGENYDLVFLTNQVDSNYSVHLTEKTSKKSETDNLVSFCFGFFLILFCSFFILP